jgi:NAD(P)H-hydrate epimerase
MSRGGSGDVLTGIITSLLAQRYHPFDAARLGVFIHGQAGDFSARKYSEHSMRVTDLSESIIDVFNFYFSYEHRESIHYWA